MFALRLLRRRRLRIKYEVRWGARGRLFAWRTGAIVLSLGAASVTASALAVTR